MSALRLLILFGALLCITTVRAEDPVVRLPAEGTWVRYHVVRTVDSGEEHVSQTTLKFLAQKDHNGIPCRWLEFVQRHQNQNDSTFVYQFLVPELALRENVNPLWETLVANHRIDDGELTPLPKHLAATFGTYLLFLPGSQKNAKLVEVSQTVDYQQGRLKISNGHRGVFRWSREAVTVKQTQTIVDDYIIWLDPMLPVGFARSQMQGRFELDGVVRNKWTENLYLEDFGGDAQSSFPKEKE